MGESNYGIDPIVAAQIALDIADIQAMGVETAIVIGGGNIFRGVAASARGMDRATADYMGMLATVINALALQDALIWKKDASSSSGPAPAIPSSALIRRRRCGPWRSRPK